MAVSCPRCGGLVRPPDSTFPGWRCDACGPVPPLHVAEHVGPDIVELAVDNAGQVPIWCPWPLLPGWTVTGVGWVGDDRGGTRATALACAGPGPLGGPADVLLVAEEPGLGMGNRFAALPGPDPGPYLEQTLGCTAAHAKVRAGGRPTPLWAVGGAEDRSAYVGEARGLWLYAVTWPADAGYLFAEDVVLHDLTEWLPAELVYGAPSPYLHGAA
jgi:uncharacterized protein DUF6758